MTTQARLDPAACGEMLLGCLTADIGHLAQLSDGEWDDVLRESVRQGMAPLLYRRLQRAGLEIAVPARVTECLRTFSRESVLKSLRQYREVSGVLRALREASIPVVVLKGAYLAEHVYEDKGLRPMRDIDLMIRGRDLARAEERLRTLGYAPRPEPHSEWDYSACAHLHPLISPAGTLVEIHWTIESPTAPFAVDVDGLWSRARPTTIAGVNVLALSTEDLLLHLCLHTTFHHQLEQGLRGCWDIFETVRRCGADIDWDQIEQRAREWRAEKYVALTLLLASELLGVAVPPEVLGRLAVRDLDPKLIGLARAEILSHRTRDAVSAPFARLCGAGGLVEKMSLLARAMFPTRKSLLRMYPACRPSSLIYLYYFARWKNLLRKYAMPMWRMVRGDRHVAGLVQREKRRAVLRRWLGSASV